MTTSNGSGRGPRILGVSHDSQVLRRSEVGDTDLQADFHRRVEGSPAYYRWRMRLYRLMLAGDSVLSAGGR